MKKILFIAAHRLNRSPSQRFRFEQYLPFLEQNGFSCTLAPLLDETDDKIFYSEGNFFSKTRIVIQSWFKRKNDLKNASNYDIIFIQREAFMTGSAFFERGVRRTNKKIIFDFDDAIWLPNVSEGNRRFEWLKNPGKTAEIISLADAVVAGNNFLAEYAKKLNKNVYVIPTTIDTAYHKRKSTEKNDRVCIGWTGSHTTIPHFEIALPVLSQLKKKYGNKIYYKLIGDEKYFSDELNLRGIRWNLQTEIEDLSEIDIGIMPLPNNEWAKGKCACKGLQYMALGMSTVMSAVGMNREIISDGENGFLAYNTQDWEEKLSKLVDDTAFRRRMGEAARKTVEEKYSTKSREKNYLDLFKSL